MKEQMERIIAEVEKNSSIQGHICINNSKLFDVSVKNGVYGFPGQGNPTINNLKVTAWRAISSLYNIGPEDLIFLYRTSGDAPGSQEFHGLFRVLNHAHSPLLLLHPQDEAYLPRRQGKQYLPFRFLFSSLTKNPVSIPNDLRNKTYKKNNNLEIIKALSETDPKKPRLWGFRHPSVMNIGAARKSSIVAISNKQVRFLLELLLRGEERQNEASTQTYSKYDPTALPSGCTLLDTNFLTKHFSESSREVSYEAELYAYIIHSIKNPRSPLHRDIMEDFNEINRDMNLSFNEIAKNVILEVVLTPHIQEEIDILLCDHDEENFLILEIKNDMVTSEDGEQCQKYVQLVNHQFPKCKSVTANVIGLRNPYLSSGDPKVKIVSYEIERISDDKARINFRLAR